MIPDRDQIRASAPALSAVPQIMKDLRALQVCIFHPHDHDGESLTKQIERIGCQVQAFWPPLLQPPPKTDIVFIAVNPDMIHHNFEWCRAEDAPPVVAVVAYENPTIIEAVLRIGAKGVIGAPIRSLGILSALVLVRETTNEVKKLRRRVIRLEEKLGAIRLISNAQDILCQQRGISKEEAYRMIREQAMCKRTTAEEVAAAIVHAHEVLSFKI
ncbi:ANTAR domain-containing response regulator [Glaciimonas immobilis]|uniref:AmiR/NasT family two-component response regulator n=1 Tax=Glaciimonas immobilis TaxID=728004 RepID=A0A840RRN9_9BURK|nr:ANTAR domain-containing protein [Glaciimonas immobilis]KAF3999869.1 ANTAR domain-containing protein [Glaciimonas immobilis]MBB5200353.1 AmiR/NasT family two-component response regulator [Glaciimonas immobilis]